MVSFLSPEAARVNSDLTFFPEAQMLEYKQIIDFLDTLKKIGDEATLKVVEDEFSQLILALNAGNNLASAQSLEKIQMTMDNYIKPKSTTITPPPEISQID